jgi:hypothetical protein
MGGGGGRGIFIPPEELALVEKLYKVTLPLPNPDVHEVIAKELNMHPKKSFSAINLVRMKMKLPKLDFPKRPLAVTSDQLAAVQALYETYIKEPPIGIHKIIAKQLRMEEWRVHVAIKLIRKSHNLPQWNEDRPDLPEHMKEALQAAKERMAELQLADGSFDLSEFLDNDATTPTQAEHVHDEHCNHLLEVSESATVEADEVADKPKKRGRPSKKADAIGADASIELQGVKVSDVALVPYDAEL